MALDARGPVVTLLHDEILVDGVKLSSMLDFDPASIVPALSARPERTHGSAIVQADRAADFEVVRKTIGALNAAGWTRIAFAVLPTGDAP
jgi:hypothetical protein